MLKDKSKFNIGYRNLFLGIFGLIFSYFFYLINEELETIGIIFISLMIISSFTLIWNYINPKTTTIRKNSKKAKEIELEKLKETFNSVNIKSYNEKGFKAIIERNEKSIEWNEINLILIVCQDLFLRNEICLYLRIDNGKGFEICETSVFWKELNTNLIKNLNGISPNWLKNMKIETGEFISKRKLYERKNVGQHRV